MTPELTRDYVYVLRTCDAERRGHGGFQWPASGPVEAPDFMADRECGHGLHGFLWGAGDGSLANWDTSAKWLVVRVEAAVIVDLGAKVKFSRGEVVFCGGRQGATEYMAGVAPATSGAIIGYTATAGDSGTATAGYAGTATAGDSGTATAGTRGTATAGYAGTATAGTRGTATAGYAGTATAGDLGTATAGGLGTATAGDSGTATAGDSGTATAGDSGTATAGYAGTATAGYAGTATAGEQGIIVARYYDYVAQRYRIVVGYIGDAGLKPNTAYRLDDAHAFAEIGGAS